MKTIEILIAISLVCIAYQNWRIQKDKLRLDLYDKRYKIFQAIKDLSTSFLKNGVTNRKDLSQFIIDTSEVDFLFEDDIKENIDEIRKKSLRAIHLAERLDNRGVGTQEDRENIAKELEELEKWSINHPNRLKSLFKEYLWFK